MYDEVGFSKTQSRLHTLACRPPWCSSGVAAAPADLDGACPRSWPPWISLDFSKLFHKGRSSTDSYFTSLHGFNFDRWGSWGWWVSPACNQGRWIVRSCDRSVNWWLRLTNLGFLLSDFLLPRQKGANICFCVISIIIMFPFFEYKKKKKTTQ